MTTLADQLAQALALVSTGALDEDYSKIAAAAAVAEQPSETPSPSSLRRAGLLGCGGFASVWLVVEEPAATPLDSMCAAAAARVPPRGYRPTTPGQRRVTHRLETRSIPQRRWALKQLRKGLLAKLGDEAAERVLVEKAAHEELRHPFILSLVSAFQDATSLYFLLELAEGGDLFDVCGAFEGARLSETTCQFYSASLALALDHMHTKQYVYRDLKPENVLLDARGYVKLADLGYAKKIAKGESRTFTQCGTEEYAPPELLHGRGRTYAADWWGLGVLLYELLLGRPPFEGETAAGTFELINTYAKAGPAANNALRGVLVDEGVTADGAAIVGGLLVAREPERLGCTADGFAGLSRHPWYATTDWRALLHKQVAAPWLPPPLDPGRLAEKARRAEVEHAKVLEELPFDVKRGAAFAKFGPVATLDLDGGQDEFDVDATPATPDVVANTSPELF